MTTSFYFVMWILAYEAIDLSGIGVLGQNAFLVSLVAVYFVGILASKFFSPQIAYYRKRSTYRLMEIVYNDDYTRYRRMLCGDMLFAFASLLYLAVATFSLILLKADIFSIVIFGLFAVLNGLWFKTSFSRYAAVRDAGRIVLSPGEENAYATYCALRASGGNVLSAPSAADTVFAIAVIAVAVIAMVLGLTFIVIYSIIAAGGAPVTVISIQIMYGVLALLYGSRDLVTALRIVRTK